MPEQDNNNVILDLILTDEELYLLIKFLNLKSFPGFNVSPEDEKDKDSVAKILNYAERSLRARGLAFINKERNLKINEVLSDLIITCSHPERSVYLHNFNQENALVFSYGHIRKNSILIHSKTEPGLHKFTIMPETASLVRDMMFYMEVLKFQEHESLSIDNLSFEILAQVKENVKKDIDLGVEMLVDIGAQLDVATQFCSDLSEEHIVSVLDFVNIHVDEETERYEVSVLHNSERIWILREVESKKDKKFYKIKTGSTEDVKQLFESWIEKTNQ